MKENKLTQFPEDSPDKQEIDRNSYAIHRDRGIGSPHADLQEKIQKDYVQTIVDGMAQDKAHAP